MVCILFTCSMTSVVWSIVWKLLLVSTLINTAKGSRSITNYFGKWRCSVCLGFIYGSLLDNFSVLFNTRNMAIRLRVTSDISCTIIWTFSLTTTSGYRERQVSILFLCTVNHASFYSKIEA